MSDTVSMNDQGEGFEAYTVDANGNLVSASEEYQSALLVLLNSGVEIPSVEVNKEYETGPEYDRIDLDGMLSKQSTTPDSIVTASVSEPEYFHDDIVPNSRGIKIMTRQDISDAAQRQAEIIQQATKLATNKLQAAITSLEEDSTADRAELVILNNES